MKAFALVSAPFHIICLSEAIDYFKINELHIVFHADENTEASRQMRSVLENLKNVKKTIHFLEPSYLYKKSLEDRIGYYGDVLSKIDRNSFQYVFFSDFRVQWQKDLIDGFQKSKRIMLDDGSITLAFIHFHLPNNAFFALPNFGTSARRQYAEDIKLNYGIVPQSDSDIDLFTIFYREKVTGKKVFPNTLAKLHRQYTNIDKSTEVIIGAKIVDRGFCDKTEYLQMLDKINSNCKGKIIYFPHRGESADHQSEIKSTFPQFEFIAPSTSIELWLLMQQHPPATFHGYVSTAFFIINMCFPQITLKCYRPSDRVINNMQDIKVYGSTLYNYSQVTRLFYSKLPKSVELIQL
ncbi:hypothetical protein Q4567_01415 [Aliiglaciecola sp. 2_MG-2023]|uniref:hypothetical protein n=1 Tax=unclassified Aliiglaciecola TaxID=2593648 RepID=UPI0026E479C8|nr:MULTISPECIES: hypothetical protein [unclassified Aliiglaciecola]MDO6709370.1 hypothetical protein [Aliiglaciecola sp. 2_MG-2023]MDO6750518.1 hypothetical protein [Aliiglaciecola sp. 1_MG-2023]